MLPEFRRILQAGVFPRGCCGADVSTNDHVSKDYRSGMLNVSFDRALSGDTLPVLKRCLGNYGICLIWRRCEKLCTMIGVMSLGYRWRGMCFDCVYQKRVILLAC